MNTTANTTVNTTVNTTANQDTVPSLPGETDVVVIGAGPTGLMLACELLRRGVRCVVVDRRGEPSSQQRALIVWSGALEALDAIGAADEVVAKGVALRAASYWSGAKRIGAVGFGALRDTRFTGPICLPQPGVEAALRRRLAELGGRVEYGTELVGLDDAKDRVTARLADRDGRALALTASWLVGCDGAHSRVRDLIGVPFDGESYQETFMLADGTLPGGPKDEARYYLVPGGVCVIVPLPGGAHRVFVSDTNESGHAQEDRQDPGNPGSRESRESRESLVDASEAEVTAAVNVLLKERVPGNLELTDPLWASRFRVHRKLASVYRVGRCLLAGDAAHVHSPAGGQGMNTGIQDAANLGWKLASAVRRPETVALLDSYQAERKPIATKVSALSDQQTRTWFLSKPAARAVRNAVMGALSRSGLLEKRMVPAIAQLDLDYTASPAVAVDALTANAKTGKGGRSGKAAKALVPGRRMPRVAISAGDGSELTVGGLLRDPRFHVLIVPEIETSATSQSQSQSLPVYLSKLVASGFDDRAAALVDSPRGTLAHLLTGRSAGPTALLVRPDGYLAARIDGVDAQSLTSALTRHLGAAGVASPQPGAQAPAVALSTAA